MDFFKGRSLVIATKHGKEKVLAPLFESHLGVRCSSTQDFDTDTLGTFSGEIPRKGSALSTAREKCLKAMELAQADLGVASEGSFGAHPHIPFIPSDEETLIFIDRKNQLEVFAVKLSTETNFQSEQIHSLDILLSFSERVGFPSHKIILKGQKGKELKLLKGIQSISDLVYQFTLLTDAGHIITAETDMRAINNPTRMKVIEQAALKLIEKIKNACPKCGAPGFQLTSAAPGLPCSLCKTPTASILEVVHTCQVCAHTEIKANPDGKSFEDPMFCPSCNP